MSTETGDVPIMRRWFVEVLMSVGTVTLLLVALVVLDDRVRDQISRRFVARPAVELAAAGGQVQSLAHVIAVAVRAKSFANAPLLIFAVAGTILFLFMLRT